MTGPPVIAALDAAAARRATEIAADLVHDVGKYMARAARNIPEGHPISAPLAAMLLRDCFETHRGRPGSERFEELASPLRAIVHDDRLAAVRDVLVQIDAKADAARAGDQEALAVVAVHARNVDGLLRELAKELRAHAAQVREA